MRELRVREATNADVDHIRDFIFGVLAEYGLPGYPDTIDADLGDLERHYRDHGGRFEIVEGPDGALVGTVAIYRLSPDTCELRRMYLARPCRGQGLGRWLLERALATGRTLGFRRIELETARQLVEAIALYQRHGFLPLERHLADCCDLALGRDL